jgi:multisubunit Na+/H+ antiporter MnhF subunit
MSVPAIETQASWLAELAETTSRGVAWLATAGVILLCGGLLLCLYRIIRGPTLADRAVGADVLAIQLVGLVAVLSVRQASAIFLDSILILTLLGFAGTVAVAQFIARPHMSVADDSDDPDRLPAPSAEEPDEARADH